MNNIKKDTIEINLMDYGIDIKMLEVYGLSPGDIKNIIMFDYDEFVYKRQKKYPMVFGFNNTAVDPKVKTPQGNINLEYNDLIIELVDNTYRVIKKNKNEYLKVKWQEGTILEAGVNGVQIVEVIQAALDRTIEINSLYPCRENEDTIMRLEQAILHQNNRTRDRKVRNVEGTYHR